MASDPSPTPASSATAVATYENLALEAKRLRQERDTIAAELQQLIHSLPAVRIWQRYHDLSSTINTNEGKEELERRITRHVWETGGSAGRAHHRNHSHFRGSRRFPEDKWLRLGRYGRADVLRHPRCPAAPTGWHILEYGPGGGMNLYALAEFAAKLYGADISKPNLDECGRQLRTIGADFQPILIMESLDVLSDYENIFDLFVSWNVFQHLPSRRYGQRVLEHAFRLMKPGALAVVQIRFDNGDPRFIQKNIEDYDSVEGHTYATVYRIDLFNDILQRIGFNVDCIGNIKTSVNYATFWFSKPGSSS